MKINPEKSDNLILLTTEELAQIVIAAEIRGAAIALDQSLLDCHEDGIKRLREMKTKLRHKQMKMEINNATKH